MCSYAIVLADGSYGPSFPSLEEAAAWAREHLPRSEKDGWISVATTENGRTAVDTGFTLGPDEGA